MLTDAVAMVTAAVVEMAAGICTGLISPFGICIITWRKYCGFLLLDDGLVALEMRGNHNNNNSRKDNINSNRLPLQT